MWGSSEAMGRATALPAQAPERTLEGGPRPKWPIGGTPRPPTCPSRGNRPGLGGNRGGRGSSSPALSSKPSQPPSPEVTSGLRGLHHGFNFSDLDACQVKYFNSVDSSSRSRFPWQRGLTHRSPPPPPGHCCGLTHHSPDCCAKARIVSSRAPTPTPTSCNMSTRVLAQDAGSPCVTSVFC